MARRRPRGAVLLAAAALVLAAPLGARAQEPATEAAPAEVPAARPARIDRNGVLILVRSTILALDQANATGNYSVLRDLAAPGFRDANNPAQLAAIFANLRERELDLSGVAVLEPQLTVLPEIGPDGLMRLAGFFPSVPLQIDFELLYAPVDGRWRVFGLSVAVNPASLSAPEAPPEPAVPLPSQRPDAPELEPLGPDGSVGAPPPEPGEGEPAGELGPAQP